MLAVQSALITLWRILELAAIYIWELTLSNFQVAWIVWQPKLKMQPAFVRTPIQLKNENAQLLLANLITMTPGTVTIDISDDRKTLYVHALNISDAESLRQSIQTVLERRLKAIFERENK